MPHLSDVPSCCLRSWVPHPGAALPRLSKPVPPTDSFSGGYTDAVAMPTYGECGHGRCSCLSWVWTGRGRWHGNGTQQPDSLCSTTSHTILLAPAPAPSLLHLHMGALEQGPSLREQGEGEGGWLGAVRGAVGTQPTEHINPQLKKIIKNYDFAVYS